MKEFLISFVFTGLSLVILIPGFILIEKKKRSNFLKILDKKELELTSIIDDAEEMLEELTRFSEYIVNVLDKEKDEVDELTNNKQESLFPEKQLHDDVLELVEQGLGCGEIARKLNRGKGEIQLILDMKKYY
jgi:tRNA uridine 5-carbamoylmethylation protein Kti12